MSFFGEADESHRIYSRHGCTRCLLLSIFDRGEHPDVTHNITYRHNKAAELSIDY